MGKSFSRNTEADSSFELDLDQIYVKGAERKGGELLVDVALIKDRPSFNEDQLQSWLEKRGVEAEVEAIPMSHSCYRLTFESEANLTDHFTFVDKLQAKSNFYRIKGRVNRVNDKLLLIETKLLGSLQDILGDVLPLFEGKTVLVKLDCDEVVTEAIEDETLREMGFYQQKEDGKELTKCNPRKEVDRSEVLNTIKQVYHKLPFLEKLFVSSDEMNLTLQLQSNQVIVSADNYLRIKQSLTED